MPHTLDSLWQISRQINRVRALAGVFFVLAILFLYLFKSFYGFQDDLRGLWLVGIEISSGVVITLLIVEYAIDLEKKRVQSQFASLDRGYLCDSLTKLVVLAYIRLFKGDTDDIFSALARSDDSRLSDLYIFGGKGGYDEIISLIEEMAGFSAQDFVLGIGVDKVQSLSLQERSAVIAGRFNAYGSDSFVIRRDLPALIDRAIQTSSNVDDVELLYRIKGLAADHDEAVAIPLKTELDAAERSREISNKLTLMMEEFAHFKLYNYPSRDKRA
jgi:hypothetical protein